MASVRALSTHGPIMYEIWIPRVRNTTTGDVPTLYVGASPTETRASCELAHCPLLPQSAGGPAGSGDVQCYAWCGTPRLAISRAWARVARGGDASLERALELRNPRATIARLGALGEPYALGRDRLRAIDRLIRSEGLGILNYTHAWRRARWLARFALASCETPTQADTALARGFRAALIVPSNSRAKTRRTPAGNKAVLCPAKQGLTVCNDCGLCDPIKPGPIVVFPNHGPGTR